MNCGLPIADCGIRISQSIGRAVRPGPPLAKTPVELILMRFGSLRFWFFDLTGFDRLPDSASAKTERLQGFRLRQASVTVFTTSGKASDFAGRVAMVRSSGEASSDATSDWSADRSAVAERHALLHQSPCSAFRNPHSVSHFQTNLPSTVE